MLAPLTVTSTPVDAASVTILLPLVMKVPSSATSAVNFAPLPNTSTIPVWFVPLNEDPKMIWPVAPIINLLEPVNSLSKTTLLLPVTLTILRSVLFASVKLPFDPKITLASPDAEPLAVKICTVLKAWKAWIVVGRSNFISFPPAADVLWFKIAAVTPSPVILRVPPLIADITVVSSKVPAVPILICATVIFSPSIIGFPALITTLCPTPLPMFPWDQLPASIHKLLPALLLKYLCPYPIDEMVISIISK